MLPGDEPEPEMADLLKIQMELLDWNRAQPDSPIHFGREYFVAKQALEIMGKAPAELEISDAQLERLGQYVYEELGSPSDWCGFGHDGARKALGAVRPPLEVPVGNSDPRPTRARPPAGVVCKGSAALGTACGNCERCDREKERSATVPKHKFDCLVEHCKRLDEEIARYRREAHDLRLYQDNAVWFWQGDNQDHLESLSCPVVIPASELRELLRRE
jgi:hypothetical protein